MEGERGGIYAHTGMEREEGGFQWEVWDFSISINPRPSRQHYVLPKLHQSYISSSSEMRQREEPQENGTVEQKLELPKWPLEILPLCASYALISSLTPRVCVCV